MSVLRMHDRDGQVAEKSQSNVALLGVAEAIVHVSEGQSFERLRSVDEIESVKLEIRYAPSRRPGEFDVHNVFAVMHLRQNGQPAARLCSLIVAAGKSA